MAFLHPNYFPFCPAIGFDAPSAFRRARFQGPFSLEQAMALYWMIGSITISGTQVGPEDFPYNFTFTGPSTMSELLCPDPTRNNAFGWEDLLDPPPGTVFDDPLIFQVGGEFNIPKGVVFDGGAYYVYFDLRLATEEGAPIIADSETFNTTKTLQITDDISVPITFRTQEPAYTSTIDSLTCTLRDPS